jgi:hypothetical protein
MGQEGKPCLGRIEIKEENAVRLVQFSKGGYEFSRLRGIVDEDDLQFFAEDSSVLVDPFPGIEQTSCAFPTGIPPSARERDQCSHLKRILTESRA